MVPPESGDNAPDVSRPRGLSDLDLLEPLDIDNLKPSDDDLEDLLTALEQDDIAHDEEVSVTSHSDLLREELLSPSGAVSLSGTAVASTNLDGESPIIDPVGNLANEPVPDFSLGPSKLGGSPEAIVKDLRNMESSFDGLFADLHGEEQSSSGKRRRMLDHNRSLPSIHLHGTPSTVYVPGAGSEGSANATWSTSQMTSAYIGKTKIHNDDSDIEGEGGHNVPISAQDILEFFQENLSSQKSSGKRRRAERRPSLPSMHLHYATADPFEHRLDDDNDEQEEVEDVTFIARDPHTGRMPRRSSLNSYFQDREDKACSPNRMLRRSSLSSVGESHSTEDPLPVLSPDQMMTRLRALMKRSSNSQKALQVWDKEKGLPRSHSQTMVNSSRSRKQLEEGVILPKWDGTPLISKKAELGKPKPRKSSLKTKEKTGGKMKRRMSAPASFTGVDY